jgi:tartrate dehydratase beta subunit/fumarate hydratase class I family protein
MFVCLTGCSQILGIHGFTAGDGGGSGSSGDPYLKASNTDPGDNFGFSLALSADGTTLAVGAYLEASAAAGIAGDQTSNAAAASGAVYVFAYDGTAWAQQAYVKASNPDAMDQFGRSLALSADGTTLAVGADGEASTATGGGGDQTNNAAAAAGAVYVLSRTGATWAQSAYLKASNTGADDQFGYALALSGDGATLAVGAPLEDGSTAGIDGASNENASSAGAVYVFALGTTAWAQQAYVKASNPGANDRFGNALALSADGSTLAVTAPFEDSGTKGVGTTPDELATDSGAVYVLSRTGTTWTQQAYVKASNTEANDRFGAAIAVTPDAATLVVGADGDDSNSSATPDDNSATDSGAVHVFSHASGTWTPAAFLKAEAPFAGDGFGLAVAIGSSLVIGAPNEANATGGAYVFDMAGAFTRHLTAANAAAGDKFGSSVAVSRSGATTLAVSAIAEDSSATGVDGDPANDDALDSGAVYVFP